ncbi:kinase-like protein [Hypoxylon sp. FL0890]|nr:kinase-like protein [Hypoxylon sp. FL0890]
MAEELTGQPKNYAELCQVAATQFDAYRRFGIDPSWNNNQIAKAESKWRGLQLPRPGQPLMFVGPREKWQIEPYWVPPKGQKTDLEGDTPTGDDVTDRAKTRYAKAKNYFSRNPQFKFHKVLGHGGLGLALHYRYDNRQDVAVKLSLKGWEANSIRHEEKMTKKMLRAAHSIQVIDPPSVGIEALEEWDPKPISLDSSDEEESSGDESVDERPPPKKPRREVTDDELDAKYARWNQRMENWEERQVLRPGQRKDFMFIEFVPGGDLENLIRRLEEASPEGQSTRIPNRVLWELWLCLVRACVGMKYPPRKFHPSRPKPSAPGNTQQDLIEIVPPEHKRWRAKNIVHFDIDPSNVFIGNLEMPTTSSTPINDKRKYDVAYPDREEREHHFLPRLKLADFGLATDVKRHKRNVYYFWKRKYGKDGFFAPEQFGEDWDVIPTDQDGAEISEQDIAGNYGSCTNIWGIAMLMWILITQLEPPKPVQPQIPEGVIIPPTEEGRESPDIDAEIRKQQPNAKVSYCPLLMDGDGGFYSYIDVELRRTIYECMYHNPTHRPTIEALLEQAQEGVRKSFANESDQVVREFTNRFIFDADY